MIPIYRAKKKDSNEYTEGFLYQDIISYVPSDGVKPDKYNKALDEESWFLMDNIGRNKMIDISTLSIHFPNMIDSKGNKIFASLQDDGFGGDIIDDGEYEFVLSFDGRRYDLRFKNDNTHSLFNEWDDWNQFTKTGIL